MSDWKFNDKPLLHSAQVAQHGSHNWLYNFYILWISLPGQTCKILHRADFVGLCTGACVCVWPTLYTHPQCHWQKDARHCSLNFHVNYQNQSDWSFPSVAHHVSSASGQAAAGVGQRADATVRFPWQQRRGSETRNVANTPSSHRSPMYCIAKDSAVLGGGGGRGSRKSPNVFTFQVAEFPK